MKALIAAGIGCVVGFLVVKHRERLAPFWELARMPKEPR